jgi:LysM repeat protein
MKGLAGLIAGVLAFGVGLAAAHAKKGVKGPLDPKDIHGAKLDTPDAIEAFVARALATEDPSTMEAAAAELERQGHKDEATLLRMEAAHVRQGGKVLPPEPKPKPGPPVHPHHPGIQKPAKPKPPHATGLIIEPPEHPYYTVQPGDSLWKIAELYTGSGNRGHELAEANHSRSPKPEVNIWNGEHLTLPDGWPTSPPGRSAAPGVPAHHAEALPPPPGPPPPPPPSSTPSYTVQAGDSAWKIAQDKTGDGNRWHELTALNSHHSPPFPAVWKGEHLVLPDSWVSDSVSGLPAPLTLSLEAPGRVRARELSEHLKALGGADGERGKENRETVAAFQQAESLDVNGFYGPGTAIRILEKYGLIPVAPWYWSKTRGPEQREAFITRVKLYWQSDERRAAEYAALIRDVERT